MTLIGVRAGRLGPAPAAGTAAASFSSSRRVTLMALPSGRDDDLSTWRAAFYRPSRLRLSWKNRPSCAAHGRFPGPARRGGGSRIPAIRLQPRSGHVPTEKRDQDGVARGTRTDP